MNMAMNMESVAAIANAVLYEGYLLYPYRPSPLKNQQRWTFGAIFPHDYAESGEPYIMQTQCLVRGNTDTRLLAHIRFLQLIRRNSPWDEAMEREVVLPEMSFPSLTADVMRIPIHIPAGRENAALSGMIEISSEFMMDNVYRLTLRIENTTKLPKAFNLPRDTMQRFAFVSLHAILGVENGSFLSLTDPPKTLVDIAQACDNQGIWPVLAGTEGSTDTLLCSPIILPDYPQIAAESSGDLFDDCEIDEMLILRIMTMSDEEKKEMADSDPRAAELLNRIEAMSAEQLSALHGTLRRPHGEKPWLASINVNGVHVSVGDRVRLRPKNRVDIMDVVLDGALACVERIECDYENHMHLEVTLESDPGRDLNMGGRMPGHRFFFDIDEVEPVKQEAIA